MADPISSIPGVSSGIDWKSLVDQIVTIDRRPAVKMESTISLNTKRRDTLEQFRQVMTDLKTAADALKTGTAFDAYSSQTAGTDAAGRIVATAVGAAGAVPGSYSLEVTQLAKAQKTISSVGFPSASTDLALSGRLVIAGQNVDIAPGDTLADVRDKINLVAGASNVQATLVAGNADGSGQRLVLTGMKTGAVNAFTPTDDPGNAQSLVTALGLGGAPQTAAQDAVMTIDGAITVSRPTNTVSDALTGVTLTLSAEGTSKVDISRHDAAVTGAMQAFVDAFNAVQDFVKKNADDPKATLARDATLRGVRTGLTQNVIAAAGGGSAADLDRLSAIGISLQKDGKLKFDNTTFKTAYPARLNDVKKLLTDRMGAVSTAADDVAGAGVGQIDRRETAIDLQSASLQRHVNDIDARLEKKRTSLLLQYSRSEAMLGKLKSMGDSLSAQLTGLNAKSS